MDIRNELQKQGEQIDKKRSSVQRQHYQDLAEAKSKGIPVAYCSGHGPTEICYAMGVLPCVPENYITISCAKQTALKFCETAEVRGIARDLCSYARVGLGMMWLEDGPLGALPKPNLIIAYPLLCDAHSKWWEIEAKYFGVPLFKLDGPFIFSGQPEPHQVEWMAGELRRLCAFIEQVIGRKFDYDRFKEAIRLSAQAYQPWWEVQKLRKSIPCPRGLREGVGDLFYVVTQLGTPGAVEYFTMLRDYTKKMVENNVGILPKERFRLVWDNIPIWYRLQLIDYFSERGAVFCMDTYSTAMWAGGYFENIYLDPEKPFESLALLHLYKHQHRGLEAQMNTFEKIVKEWHCDGAVFFCNRSCQILSRSLKDRERLLKERMGIPSLDFEAEMADPRSLAEADVKAKIDAFLELLEQTKK